jgi:alpha-D-xyloside xylohydrolase
MLQNRTIRVVVISQKSAKALDFNQVADFTIKYVGKETAIKLYK